MTHYRVTMSSPSSKEELVYQIVARNPDEAITRVSIDHVGICPDDYERITIDVLDRSVMPCACCNQPVAKRKARTSRWKGQRFWYHQECMEDHERCPVFGS